MIDPRVDFLNSQNVKEFVDSVYKSKIIGIDTEFDNDRKYFPVLSLVQVSTRDGIYIFDALDKTIDGTFIKNIFADRSIIKILHSCRQDIETIWHNLDVGMRSVIDTQIMAEYVGYGKQIGYGKLVENVFGVDLDKKYQYSDWMHRPIAEEKVKYASKDVLFLPFLYQKLKENILNIDFEKMVQRIQKIKNDTAKGRDIGRLWHKLKIFYSSSIRPNRLPMLRKLFFERENIAKNLNVLSRLVLGDKMLIRLAHCKQSEVRDLFEGTYTEEKRNIIEPIIRIAMHQETNTELSKD